MVCDLADKSGMQQRLPSREAHSLMRDFLQKLSDVFCRLLCRQRIGQPLKLTRAGCRLRIAEWMRIGRILGIAVAAVEVAALEPHKDLTAADVFALALNR